MANIIYDNNKNYTVTLTEDTIKSTVTRKNTPVVYCHNAKFDGKVGVVAIYGKMATDFAEQAKDIDLRGKQMLVSGTINGDFLNTNKVRFVAPAANKAVARTDSALAQQCVAAVNSVTSAKEAATPAGFTQVDDYDEDLPF